MKRSLLLTAFSLVMGQAYLPLAAQKAIPYAHNEDVIFQALSPSGMHAITADSRMAILWDTRTGQSMAKHDGHFFSPSSTIDFDPSGKYGFMGSIGTESLEVYETATATRVKTLPFPGLIAAFFGKDGESIVTVDADSIKVTAWKSGRTLKAFAHETERAILSRFLLNNKGTHVYATQNGVLRRFNLQTGMVDNYYNAPGNGSNNKITSFSSSPSGAKEAVSFLFGETIVFDNATGKAIANLHFDRSHNIFIDAQGRADTIPVQDNYRWYTSNTHFFLGEDTLVTIADFEIALWSLKANKQLNQLAFDYWIDKKFIPVERNKIWLLGSDSAYLLQVPALQVEKKVAYPQPARIYDEVGDLHGNFTHAAASLTQPLILAIAKKSKAPMAFSLQPHAAAVQLAPGVKSLKAYSYLPADGNGILFTGYDTYVQGWDVASGSLVFKDSIVVSESSFEPTVNVNATPSNNYLLTYYKNGGALLKVFDAKHLQVHDTLSGFSHYDVSKTDKLVYNTYEGGTYVLHLLDLKTKKRQLLAKDIESVNFIKISPSGKYVVHIQQDLAVHIYDAQNAKLLAETAFNSYRQAISNVHFTANEEAFIIEGAEAIDVPLYATRTGKRLKVITSPGNTKSTGAMVNYLFFDTGKKGVYASFSERLFYFDLQSKATRRLSIQKVKPFKYEKDGSFWVRNTAAYTLERYLPKPGGTLTLVEKRSYAKGYTPFSIQGNTWFSSNGKAVTVQTVDAKGVVQQQYTLYSMSVNETIKE